MVIKIPSIGNKAKLVSSMTCQQCARCCKEFTWDENLNFALRFAWMGDKKLKAKDTPFTFDNGEPMKKMIWKCQCTQLEFKDRKYRCKAYDKERPTFCNTYPDHIFYGVDPGNSEKIMELLEDARKDCPGLKSVTVHDVSEMLKKD